MCPFTGILRPVTERVPSPPTQTQSAANGQIEVKRIGHEGAVKLVDLMGGSARHEVRVHDHGFVALVDVMPRMVPEGQTADQAVVQAARVSYGIGTRQVSEDRGLVRYLMRHRHTTPFEMVEFKFHCAMPIFVARQWIRHRTANVNEYSGRYSVMPDRFYRPGVKSVREQSSNNRQGGEAPAPESSALEFLAYLDRAEDLYEEYQRLIEKGISRELARIGLPQSLYTEWYWKCDLHNTLRFLALRADAHAQSEIRAYAMAMWSLIEPIAPHSMEAFRDYEMEAVRLTRLEVAAMRERRDEIDTTNKREQAEWHAKRAALGLDREQAGEADVSG